MNPLVSVIVPTHNSEATIVRTLNSLIEQTLSDLEIIVVDDASTDSTVALCREAGFGDSRIVTVPQDENQTVLQARRIGVQHATGTYVMFCDADDELAPQAAEEASSFALGGGYDVVHFGTTIISATGSKHGAWERALGPFGTELFGDEILLSSAFGQPGTRINGHIWNKLYDRRLVEDSWKAIDPELRLPRGQDIYQTLLILVSATRYGGFGSSLYRYNFRAGKSGNVADRESFQHFLASARMYQAVAELMASENWIAPAGFDSDEMLERLRDQVIDNQLNYWFQLPRPAEAALGDLLRTWGAAPVLKVLANRHAGKIRTIVEAFSRLDVSDLQLERGDPPAEGPQHVAILGNISGIGGVQKVMAVQADFLVRAGHPVTILSFDHEPGDLVQQLPPGVVHRSLGPRQEVGATVAGLIRRIREDGITIILNHDNYSPLFPWTAAITRTLGVHSALFLHSFSLRLLLDFRAAFAYLPEIARSYDMTVALSEAERMWWEALGVPRVRVLPNFAPPPPSEALSGETTAPSDQDAPSPFEAAPPSVDLLWVGRLHDETKNISGLLEAFAQVVAQRPDTTLAIVGGEYRRGDLARLEEVAERLNIGEQVLFPGPTQNVEAWYRSAKVFFSTSVIEGFPLTLVEAQRYGLPIAMYDLPYLTVSESPGIISVEWGATERLAHAALNLLQDPERSEIVGAAGRDFTQRFSLDNYGANFRSIVSELVNLQYSTTRNSPSSTSDAITAVVSTSFIGELYRLYELMHRRTNSKLRSAERESADLRKNLSQLKRSLAESQAQHQQVAKAIEQIENKKTAAPLRRKGQQPRSTHSGVGGVWPLWARQGVQPFDTPSSSVFEDVPATAPVALPAAWALDCGVLGATTARQFDGDSHVTRYEFISMLYRLAGSPEATPELAAYRDLDPDDPVVAWAIQRAIMKPARSKKAAGELPAWNPDSPFRRRNAAMMLYRAAGSPQYHAPHISPYADLAVGQKFYKEMCWVAHQGILPAIRKENTLVFEEQLIMTRAETVTALFRQMVGPIAMSKRG